MKYSIQNTTHTSTFLFRILCLIIIILNRVFALALQKFTNAGWNRAFRFWVFREDFQVRFAFPNKAKSEEESITKNKNALPELRVIADKEKTDFAKTVMDLKIEIFQFFSCITFDNTE